MWGPGQAVCIIEVSVKKDFLGIISLHHVFLLSSSLSFFPVTSYLGYVTLSSSGGGDGGPPLCDDEARFRPDVQAVYVLSYL